MKRSSFAARVWTSLALPLFAALGTCAVACDSAAGGELHRPPEIGIDFVEANPNNVVSAIFSIRAMGSQIAQVEICGDRDKRMTRAVPIADEMIRVPLLGLRAESDYLFRALLTSRSGGTTVGEWRSFKTGKMPETIVALEIIASPGVQPSLTLLAPIRNPPAWPHPAIIIDETGRVVWYKEAVGSIIDLQLQPSGIITASVARNAISPYYAGIYRGWDALGNEIGQWSASGYEYTDSHELRIRDDGSALLMGFETQTADLTRFGGPADAAVVGDVLQHISRDGIVLFKWNSLEHYSLDEADDLVWRLPAVAGYDFTHANAIEVLPNGDYLLSTRHLSEITRIDHETGEIVWRMGKGKGNQFRFLSDPKGGFWNMHAVRRLPNGHLILIDNGNGHSPPSSRAVEYEIDEMTKTATLLWSFEPGITSCCMGYAQRLANGNTLVNLGEDHRVFEVSPGGEVVWEARLPGAGAGFYGIYRATRISSLDDLR